MPRFVHTADLHFDTPFSARFKEKEAELRRKEMMQTFRRIVEQAAEAELFLLSGDLFDSRFVSKETTAFLQRCFAEIPDTKVMIAAGNHDPLTVESVYRRVAWSENVHIFDTKLEYIDFPQWKLRVHGRSFGVAHEVRLPLEALELRQDWCNLLVVHGELVALNGESDYGAIEKPRLEESGIDYVALGHIHSQSGLQRLGTTYYAYPGIPEGRGFDETGVCGYLKGSLEKGSVQAEWVPVNSRQFLELKTDLTGCLDGIAILEKIRVDMQKAGSAADLYRIRLTGKLDRELIQIPILEEGLKENCFSIEFRDETQPLYDLNEIAQDPGLKGSFVVAMLELMDEMSAEEKAIGDLALELGLSVIERGKDR